MEMFKRFFSLFEAKPKVAVGSRVMIKKSFEPENMKGESYYVVERKKAQAMNLAKIAKTNRGDAGGHWVDEEMLKITEDAER